MSSDDDPRNCPYVGLDPFGAAHADYFFGRRQDSKVIADHVVARRVTILYGPSGVGKSSILNVGLRPALPQGEDWLILLLRDWQDPNKLERLAIEALLAELPLQPGENIRRRGFAPLVAWVARSMCRPILIVLDQFEEYFLYREQHRMLVLESVTGDLIARQDLPLRLLVALREDSLHLLDELRAFVPGILDTTIRLGPLSDAGVEEAICGPIDRYNQDYREPGEKIKVEGELVNTLKRQLKEAHAPHLKGRSFVDERQQVELPYLQLALIKLWEAEGGAAASILRERTLTDQTKLGGVEQIVRVHVKTVMDHLTIDEQALCAKIFDRLVTSIGSKVAYPTEALASPEVAGRGVGRFALEETLGKLTPKEARVLKPVVTGGAPGFEIFHDVLGVPILEWTRSFKVEAQRRKDRETRRSISILALGGAILVIVSITILARFLPLTVTPPSHSQTSITVCDARNWGVGFIYFNLGTLSLIAGVSVAIIHIAYFLLRGRALHLNEILGKAMAASVLPAAIAIGLASLDPVGLLGCVNNVEIYIVVGAFSVVWITLSILFPGGFTWRWIQQLGQKLYTEE